MDNVATRKTSPEPPAGKKLGSAALLLRLRLRASKPLRHLRQTWLRRSMMNVLMVGGIFSGFVLLVNLIVRFVL